MSNKFVGAVVIASVMLAGAPVVAASAASKHPHKMSCTQEAKHAGVKGRKEIHAYVKKCLAERRAEARKAREHAREMKREKKHEMKREMKQEHKPAGN